MIGHIKVKNHKELQEAKLENLGKINIICGKNNSGKSTILEAMNNPSYRALGHNWKEDDILRFHNDTNGVHGWNSTDSGLNKGYLNALSATFQTKTFWYYDEETEFKELLYSEIQKNSVLKNYTFSTEYVSTRYQNDINNISVDPVLISPKRKLEENPNINVNQKATPNGEFVLKELFNAKNKSEGSNEQKTYMNFSEKVFMT